MSRENTLQQELNEEIIEGSTDVGIFVLVNQQPSGFVRKGTENTETPIELSNPGEKAILTKSAYAKPISKGGKKTFERVKIRYLDSSNEILVKLQEEQEAIANPVLDRIQFKNGQIVVAGEGAGIGKLAFMRADSRNETAPHRIPGVEAVYREIFPEQEKVVDNDDIFAEADAVTYVRNLIKSKTEKGVVYDEERLNALSRLFNVVADSPAGKISSLIANAKAKPADFLKRAKEYEQTKIIEISHAISLGLISIDGTNVNYVGKNEIIHTFSDKLTNDQKMQSLSNFFSSPAGEHHYKKFMLELQTVKENNI